MRHGAVAKTCFVYAVAFFLRGASADEARVVARYPVGARSVRVPSDVRLLQTFSDDGGFYLAGQLRHGEPFSLPGVVVDASAFSGAAVVLARVISLNTSWTSVWSGSEVRINSLASHVGGLYACFESTAPLVTEGEELGIGGATVVELGSDGAARWSASIMGSENTSVVGDASMGVAVGNRDGRSLVVSSKMLAPPDGKRFGWAAGLGPAGILEWGVVLSGRFVNSTASCSHGLCSFIVACGDGECKPEFTLGTKELTSYGGQALMTVMANTGEFVSVLDLEERTEWAVREVGTFDVFMGGTTAEGFGFVQKMSPTGEVLWRAQVVPAETTVSLNGSSKKRGACTCVGASTDSNARTITAFVDCGGMLYQHVDVTSTSENKAVEVDGGFSELGASVFRLRFDASNGRVQAAVCSVTDPGTSLTGDSYMSPHWPVVQLDPDFACGVESSSEKVNTPATLVILTYATPQPDASTPKMPRAMRMITNDAPSNDKNQDDVVADSVFGAGFSLWFVGVAALCVVRRVGAPIRANVRARLSKLTPFSETRVGRFRTVRL